MKYYELPFALELIAVRPTQIPGDADSDGGVSGAGLVVWQTHFPTKAASGMPTVPELSGFT